jgi:class 3 adenylate cyclase
MKPSRELRGLVLSLLHDAASADPSFVEAISKSEGTVHIGTDAAEFYIGGPQVRAIITRQIQEIGPAKIEPETLVAFEEGSVGWAAGQWAFTFPGGSPICFRISWVFHREDGDWQLVHLHLSNPLPNRDVLGHDLTTAIDDVADLVERERPELTAAASPDGTVTIMFTDLEASTALNEAMGDDAFLPLLLAHNEIVRTRTESAGGVVVKSQGDGFLLAFPSARRAVECATAVQHDVTALDDRLKVRMGLHTGEPVHHADDFFGRDVAYAARIGSAARGGEILVSSLVRSLVAPSGSVSFEGPRPLELKGFDGPQEVFAVSC